MRRKMTPAKLKFILDNPVIPSDKMAKILNVKPNLVRLCKSRLRKRGIKIPKPYRTSTWEKLDELIEEWKKKKEKMEKKNKEDEGKIFSIIK